MLKLLTTDVESFHSFKCGEIYCETPTDYNVCCSICGHKIWFDLFPDHFRKEHLPHEVPGANDITTVEKEKEGKTENLPTTLLIEPEIKSEHDDVNANIRSATTQCLEDENPLDLKEIVQPVEENQRGANTSSSKCLQSSWKKNGQKSGEDGDVLANDVSESTDPDDDVEECKSTIEDVRFPCSLCSRAYKSRRGLLNHLRINHRNGLKSRHVPAAVHKCDECGQIFRSERHLRGHKWKHTGIFCDICGKPFTQPGNMMRHKIRHTGVKAHECKECSSSFYTEKELKAHMMRHTGLLPIICEICGRRCRDHGVLTAHMRRHTGERPAKCEVCGKCFYSVYDLNLHSVTHSRERPFACDICGSTFQTKKALRVHKKLHSEVRKHECRICGKLFAQSGGLYSHMKTHDAAEAD